MQDWKDMLAELEALYATGKRWTDAYSAIVDGDVLSFSDETVAKVGDWVQRAYNLAAATGHASLADQINALCKQCTGDGLSVADLDDLHVSDFGHFDAEGDFDEDDDEEDYKAEREDGSEEDCEEDYEMDFTGDYADPIDMRARFQLLVEHLLRMVRLAARLPKGADVVSEYWTVEDVAEMEGVKPNRVRQWPSEFKKKHGRYPAWRVPLPGRERGFLIDKAVWRQEMDRR